MVDDPLAVFGPAPAQAAKGLDDQPAAATNTTFALRVLNDFYAIPGVFEPDPTVQTGKTAKAHLQSIWRDTRIPDAGTRAEVALRLFKATGHLLTTDDFLGALDSGLAPLTRIALPEGLTDSSASSREPFQEFGAAFNSVNWQLDMHKAIPGLFNLQNLLSSPSPSLAELRQNEANIDRVQAFVSKQAARASRLAAMSKQEPKADLYASKAEHSQGHQHPVVALLRGYGKQLEAFKQQLAEASGPAAPAAGHTRADTKAMPASRMLPTEAATLASAVAGSA